jgi:hypothetical protein
VAAIQFIVHDQPARRPESNYVAQIDLTPFSFADTMEQVWLRQLSAHEFAMCCIPFRAYGLALGDVVGLSSDGTRVTELIRSSGNRVVRALLVAGLDPAVQTALSASLDSISTSLGLLREWSGDRHIAIDVPPETNIQTLTDVLASGQNEGQLFWEWANVIQFSG